MEKLQFDSFYKFLVSLGVVLIVIPFFFVNQVLSGKYDLLISQEEFDNLSTYSMQTLSFRESIYLYINKYPVIIHIVCIFLIVTGMAFLCIGTCHWIKIQKQLDDQTRYLTEKMKYEHKMAKPTKEEQLERISSMDSTEEKTKPVAKEVQTSIKIRDAFFRFLKKKYNENDYLIYQDMKMGKYYYDYIIVSKRTRRGKDYLVEVKMVTSISKILPIIDSAIKYIKDKSSEFNSCTHDILIPLLYVIVNQEDAKIDSDLNKKIQSLQKEHSIKIELLTMKTLNNFMK